MSRSARSRTLFVVALVYVVLLGASHLVERGRPVATPSGRLVEAVPRFDAEGEAPGDPVAIGSITFTPRNGATDRPPVILLHGSPGSAANFRSLGPELADAGYVAHALDMPGFGASTADVPDYSVHAYARTVLAWMDARGIGRAHIVGWSNGGGVAVVAAELAPERVASVTMLASIGLQSTEGSGSFTFEHGKYALGLVTLGFGLELVPDFGVLPSLAPRVAFLRNFWDTDQRLLEPTLTSMTVPVLIVHGDDDFLTPAWGACLHHREIPSSSLVMVDGSHFLPVAQPALTASHLVPFFDRHNVPGVRPGRSVLDLSTPSRFMAAFEWVGRLVRWVPWWVSAAVIGLAAFRFPRATAVVAGLVVGAVQLDIGVAVVGVAAGRVCRPAFAGGRFRLGRVVPLFFWSLVSVGLVFVIGSQLARAWMESSGPIGLLGAAAVLWVGLVAVELLRFASRSRRVRAARALARWRHHEFWPPAVFYLPLVPYVVWLAVRHRGVMTIACCNPGISARGGIGGGLIGESKSAIQNAFGRHPGVLETVLVPGTDSGLTDERRAAIALRAVRRYPVVLKPDAGFRGYAVRVARTIDDVRAYARSFHKAFVVQAYHPGPEECGVFWYRDPVSGHGRVYAITRKTFPEIEGDGGSTLGALIERHPRFRLQIDVFRARFAGRWDEVIPAGARVRLAHAGNHSQGVLFGDGADLDTPELTAALNEIAERFEGFDFGRFDIRYADDDSLRRGERFGIVEANGVTSESTNLYDPGRSVRWAYRVLFGQWRLGYAIGLRNRRGGVRPPSIGSLVRAALGYYRGRPRVETD